MNLPAHCLRKSKYVLQGKWKAFHLSKDLMRNARGKIAIVYHGIDMKNDTSVNTKFTGLKNFEQEMILLKKYTNVISADDYVTDNLDSERLNVTITFDDGFINQFILARPILERYGLPATFFTTTIWSTGKNILWPDLVDHATTFAPKSISIASESFQKNYSGVFFHSSGISLQAFAKTKGSEFISELYDVFMPYAKFITDKRTHVYWKLMPEATLFSLSRNPKFTIGAHSVTHVNLLSASAEEISNELVESKETLENVIQKEVKYFAAPFGLANQQTIELGRMAGYKFQFISSGGGSFAESSYDVIYRHGVNPYVSPEHQVLFILNKGY